MTMETRIYGMPEAIPCVVFSFFFAVDRHTVFHVLNKVTSNWLVWFMTFSNPPLDPFYLLLIPHCCWYPIRICSAKSIGIMMINQRTGGVCLASIRLIVTCVYIYIYMRCSMYGIFIYIWFHLSHSWGLGKDSSTILFASGYIMKIHREYRVTNISHKPSDQMLPIWPALRWFRMWFFLGRINRTWYRKYLA